MTPQEAAASPGPLDELLDAELFKALSDPTRLKLLACLVKCGCPSSVSDVTECCPVDFSVVSRHLAILEKAGVLWSVKQGRTVRYGVRYQQLSETLRALAGAIEQCCPEQENSGATRGCHAKK
jgi:ArsR family transcriptional regulator, arsenate/arsenite/antimonite-responsive transcriptional repressor